MDLHQLVTTDYEPFFHAPDHGATADCGVQNWNEVDPAVVLVWAHNHIMKPDPFAQRDDLLDYLMPSCYPRGSYRQ